MAKKHRYPRCTATGKLRYGEHKDATEAVRTARRERRTAELNGGRCVNRVDRSYSCQHCGGWHTTSKPARPPRLTSEVAQRIQQAILRETGTIDAAVAPDRVAGDWPTERLDIAS